MAYTFTVQFYFDAPYWKVICNEIPPLNLISQHQHTLAEAVVKEINRVYGAEAGEIRVIMPLAVAAPKERADEEQMFWMMEG